LLDANNCPPDIQAEYDFLLPLTYHPHPMDPSSFFESNFCPPTTPCDTKYNLVRSTHWGVQHKHRSYLVLLTEVTITEDLFAYRVEVTFLLSIVR